MRKKQTVTEVCGVEMKAYLKQKVRISFLKLMNLDDLDDINDGDFKEDDDDEEEEVWMECEVCPPL